MKVNVADAGRRYRLYLTPEQADQLTRWGHTCRWLWNVALNQRQFAYRQRGVTLRAVNQCRMLTEARADPDLAWLKELPAQAAQQVLRHLDAAYDNWWDPAHPARRPTYKRRDGRLAVPLPGQSVQVRRLNCRWAQVRLPKVGWVRFRLSRPLGGTVRNATVSCDALGWHVAFGVASGARRAMPNELPGCGVDFGVACSAYVSDETEPRTMPATLTAGEQWRLAGLERRKARQIRWAKKHNQGRYSKRLRRTIREIAQLRARQARRRADYTHKLTTDLANSHGWVGIEDLRVQAMTASAKGTVDAPGRNIHAKAGLNRGILDNTPGERRQQLAYKCPRGGSELRLVPPAGTSQTCAACGHRDPASRLGCGRVFACTACGHQDHADRNAAIIIEQRAAEALGAGSAQAGVLAAGRAVISTRSHPQVARPARRARSRMREPSRSTA